MKFKLVNRSLFTGFLLLNVLFIHAQVQHPATRDSLGGFERRRHTVVASDRVVEVWYEDNGHKKAQLTNGSGKVIYENPDWNFDESNFNYLLVPLDKRGQNITYNNGLLKIYDKKRGNVFVNMDGKEVVFSDYAYVGDFYNGLAIAGNGPGPNELNYGVISLDKKVIYPLSAEEISPFANDLLDVSEVNLHGLIRKNGTPFLPVKYEKITLFPDLPYFKLYLEDKYGVADTTGKVIIPVEYEDITFNPLSKFFTLEKEGKKEIADLAGKICIKSQ